MRVRYSPPGGGNTIRDMEFLLIATRVTTWMKGNIEETLTGFPRSVHFPPSLRDPRAISLSHTCFYVCVCSFAHSLSLSFFCPSHANATWHTRSFSRDVQKRCVAWCVYIHVMYFLLRIPFDICSSPSPESVERCARARVFFYIFPLCLFCRPSLFSSVLALLVFVRASLFSYKVEVLVLLLPPESRGARFFFFFNRATSRRAFPWSNFPDSCSSSAVDHVIRGFSPGVRAQLYFNFASPTISPAPSSPVFSVGIVIHAARISRRRTRTH